MRQLKFLFLIAVGRWSGRYRDRTFPLQTQPRRVSRQGGSRHKSRRWESASPPSWNSIPTLDLLGTKLQPKIRIFTLVWCRIWEYFWNLASPAAAGCCGEHTAHGQSPERVGGWARREKVSLHCQSGEVGGHSEDNEARDSGAIPFLRTFCSCQNPRSISGLCTEYQICFGPPVRQRARMEIGGVSHPSNKGRNEK